MNQSKSKENSRKSIDELVSQSVESRLNSQRLDKRISDVFEGFKSNLPEFPPLEEVENVNEVSTGSEKPKKSKTSRSTLIKKQTSILHVDKQSSKTKNSINSRSIRKELEEKNIPIPVHDVSISSANKRKASRAFVHRPTLAQTLRDKEIKRRITVESMKSSESDRKYSARSSRSSKIKIKKPPNKSDKKKSTLSNPESKSNGQKKKVQLSINDDSETNSDSTILQNQIMQRRPTGYVRGPINVGDSSSEEKTEKIKNLENPRKSKTKKGDSKNKFAESLKNFFKANRSSSSGEKSMKSASSKHTKGSHKQKNSLRRLSKDPPKKEEIYEVQDLQNSESSKIRVSFTDDPKEIKERRISPEYPKIREKISARRSTPHASPHPSPTPSTSNDFVSKRVN